MKPTKQSYASFIGMVLCAVPTLALGIGLWIRFDAIFIPLLLILSALTILISALSAWVYAVLKHAAEEEQALETAYKKEHTGALFDTSGGEKQRLFRTFALHGARASAVFLIAAALTGVYAAWRLAQSPVDTAYLEGSYRFLLLGGVWGAACIVLSRALTPSLLTHGLHAVAAASFVRLNGYLTLISVLITALYHMRQTEGDPTDSFFTVIGAVFMIYNALLALDLIAGLIAHAYRNSDETLEKNAPYDTHLAHILSGNTGSHFAELLRYQFGFELNQERIRAFLYRGLVPLCVLTVLVFGLVSSLCVIPANTQGLYTRIGQTQQLLAPGFHHVLPWPFGRVELLACGQQKTLLLSDGNPNERALWSDQRFGRGDAAFGSGYLCGVQTPRPVFLSLSCAVNYTVENPQRFYVENVYGEKTLRSMAESVLIDTLMQADSIRLFSTGLSAAEKEAFLARLNAQSETWLGAKVQDIVFLQLSPMPETELAKAYFNVRAARFTALKMIQSARIKALETQTRGRTEALAIADQAGRAAIERRTEAQEYSTLFQSRNAMYETYGELFRHALYYELTADYYRPLRKYFIGTDKSRYRTFTTDLDLKGDLAPTLLNTVKDQ